MSRRALTLAFAWLTLWPSAAESAPSAQDEAEARRMFEQAMALSESGRWDQACPVFAAAHALFPTGGTAMNVARCHEDAGKKAEALELYAHVLTLPDQPPARTKVANERATALRAELAAAKSPSEPPPPVSPASPPPTAADDEGIGFVPAGIAFAVGGAGLVAGAIVGGLALAQMSDVRDSCDGDVCPLSQQAAADEAQDKSWGANAAFIIGGVGVAAGVVLAIVAATSGPEARPPVPASARGLVIEF